MSCKKGDVKSFLNSFLDKDQILEYQNVKKKVFKAEFSTQKPILFWETWNLMIFYKNPF